jgi:hypothetical protein
MDDRARSGHGAPCPYTIGGAQIMGDVGDDNEGDPLAALILITNDQSPTTSYGLSTTSRMGAVTWSPWPR